MAVLPFNSFNLDLSISMPGFASSSPSRPSFVRGLDMNRLPEAGAAEEEWAVAASVGEEEEGSCISGCKPRKKLRLSKNQYRCLEESFGMNHTLNHTQKEALAMELKLEPRQVEVWFQNRRARSKLKQTEMECEYMKRWFGSLTEQNRRLRRELEELRAIKVSSSAVVTPNGIQPPLPASIITTCPRCTRMTAASVTLDKAAVIDTATATATTIHQLQFCPLMSCGNSQELTHRPNKDRNEQIIN